MTPVKTPFSEDKTNQNAAIAWLRFKNVLGLMQLKGMVDKQGLLSSKGHIEGGGRGGGGKRDLTLLLSDEVLQRIVAKLLPESSYSFCLVCHRWLRLQGLRRHSIKLKDWDFLAQGRMTSRFPNLTDVDLTRACILAPKNACIILTHASLTIPLDGSEGSFDRWEDRLLDPSSYDRGLQLLAQGCPGLQKLSVIDVMMDVPLGDSNAEPKGLHAGLAHIAHNCTMLQELELYRCTDESLRAISACKNLQILRLVGSADGVFHRGIISDIGLTILARGCSRLVKLELSGCQGSYDGIAAIGRCCFMLEELTLSNHNLDEGWIAGLSFCSNLKTLRLQGCRRIDSNPGPVEHLGYCSALETLQLQRCNMRDRQGSAALMLVCSAAKELEFQDCWGLDDEIFSLVMNCSHGRRKPSCQLFICETIELLPGVGLGKFLQQLGIIPMSSRVSSFADRQCAMLENFPYAKLELGHFNGHRKPSRLNELCWRISPKLSFNLVISMGRENPLASLCETVEILPGVGLGEFLLQLGIIPMTSRVSSFAARLNGLCWRISPKLSLNLVILISMSYVGEFLCDQAQSWTS